MQKRKIQAKKIDRISKKENLPLLRGMFVGIGSSKRKYRPLQRTENFSVFIDEELYLTAEQGYYLGE
ncbi:MAG: hypothetical protein ACOYNC_01155 [Bacteroidales bacterium]